MINTNTNKRPGWFEAATKSMVTDSGIRQVAPRHHEAATKHHTENICTNPIKLKDAKCDNPVTSKLEENVLGDNTVIFILETKMNSDERSILIEEFLQENKDTDIECHIEKILVDKKYADDFEEFLTDRKIKFTKGNDEDDEKENDCQEKQ